MIKKRLLWQISLLFLFSLHAKSQQRFVFTRPEMGTFFTITLYGKDSLTAEEAADRAFEEIERLNQIFSDYLPESELNRLTESYGKFVPVSPDLFHVIHRSIKASKKSKGAFDITIGPLTRLWRKAFKNNKPPEQSQIDEARKAVSFRNIRINKKKETVFLKKKDMRLDLGGIAKGYTAQKVLDLLKKEGYNQALVNAGGDIVAGDPPTEKSYWKIGIEIPDTLNQLQMKQLFLKNTAVATSGDLFRHLRWKGKIYSHIINPKTGEALSSQRRVTVISPDGATADWIASACSILPLKKALKLIKRFPHTHLLIIEKGNDANKIYEDSGFSGFLKEVKRNY